MMKFTIACVALAAFAAPALAADGATYELKAGIDDPTGTNVDAVTGNPVAYWSSNATGNGGVVGGNGHGASYGDKDWTSAPHSRADLIQGLLGAAGKGSQK
jgi:opacity protein-like surface antigen